VPVPKSKIRDQVVTATGLTQVAIVKSVRPLAMPAGSAMYWALPLSWTALPNLPETQLTGGGGGGGWPTIAFSASWHWPSAVTM
jgi:hypothetical protein